MKIYFVRHGVTDWNKQKRIQGQVDIPLNEYGEELARETAEGLRDVPFDYCFSSPLSRAYRTAEIILEGRQVPIVKDQRIIEISFGDWEGGCCSKEGWNLPNEFQKFFDDTGNYQAPPGNGEDFYMMHDRLQNFLDELFHDENLQDKTILITSHGAALGGIMNIIEDRPISQYWKYGVQKNCAVTLVEVTNAKPEIIFENKVYYDQE